MKAINSSVTKLKEISVMSSLWREISCSSRSKGPSKLAKWTLNSLLGALGSMASDATSIPEVLVTGVSTGEHYLLGGLFDA